MLGGPGGAHLLLAQTIDLRQPQLITDQQGLPQRFIPALAQDRQGFIWMATRDGLCRYDGMRFKVFRHQNTARPSLSFSGIYTLKTDSHNRLWILSEQGDIDRFDPRTETFTNVSRSPIFQRNFGRYGVRTLYVDPQDRLWIGLLSKEKMHGAGLVCFDTHTMRYRWFRHQPGQSHSLSDDWVKDIIQDPHGVTYVATAAGVDRFEPSTGQFAHLSLPPAARESVGHDQLQLTTLFNGPAGELLIGSLQGLIVANANRSTFHFYRLPKQGDDWWGLQFAADRRGGVFLANQSYLFRYRAGQPPQLTDHSSQRLGRCMSLLVDRSEVLWLGTDGKGIIKYDLRAYPFQKALYQDKFQMDLLTRYLRVPFSQALAVRAELPYRFRYTYDGQGKLWANVGSSTMYQIDLTSHKSRIVPLPVPFNPHITPLATDEQGRVWTLIYQQHFWYYDPHQQRWTLTPLQPDWKRLGNVLQLVADAKAFWLATETNGLFRLDRRTGQLRQFRYQANQPTSISSNALLCLSADPLDPDRLWVGTFGSGLCVFSKQTGTCQRLTTQQGLPNDVIYSALPDHWGNVWIGTNKGLCRLQTRPFRVRTYTREDGLLADEFNRFHYLQMPDGQLIMAGLDGFTSFYPDQLKDDTFKPAVELTTLTINNRLVETGTDSALGNQPIQAVDQLNLPYHQNFITLGFAALQFNRPSQNTYRYRLEGLDENWVETSQPQAVYTGLRPGSYTFWLNASNTSGRWSPYIWKLSITIQPPPWATWWAYTLYALLVGGLIWYGISTYLNRLRLQHTIALRQQEAQQLRALDELKSRFFSNVTHDFRTPLTLILSPLTDMIGELTGTKHANRLESIRRNAHQLLNLINQLLDFSKLDAQALPVQEVRAKVGEFVEQTVQLFEQEAAAKSITVTYQTDVVDEYWLDADKLERILSNLIANALKFTPAQGQITVSLQTTTDGLLLSITDTGIGIAADQLPFIFDRFFQGGPSPKNAAGPKLGPRRTGSVKPRQVDTLEQEHPVGTGIGLAFVNELVYLLKGQIEVESQPNLGTTFRVTLPFRRIPAEYQNGQLALASLPATEPSTVVAKPLPERPLGESTLGERQHLLLVEDNEELVHFIAQSLPAHYRISRAADGQQGLDMAHQLMPDLIISDVLMPVLDGFTMCQRLKADPTTQHIPVILLTAKAAHQSRIEGLSAGADDYLIKPFHPDELRLRVRNQLQHQQHLRAWM